MTHVNSLIDATLYAVDINELQAENAELRRRLGDLEDRKVEAIKWTWEVLRLAHVMEEFIRTDRRALRVPGLYDRSKLLARCTNYPIAALEGDDTPTIEQFKAGFR